MITSQSGQGVVRAHPTQCDDRLTALLADLAQLDLQARVLTLLLAGEEDVRLQAWRDGGRMTVELLWSSPDFPLPSQVAAVRVCREQREIWRSPVSGYLPADIVRFLCDLLVLDDRVLYRRYRLIG